MQSLFLACTIEKPLQSDHPKPEEGPSTSGKVKSFKCYLKDKGKEWKDRVSKPVDKKKKKVESVVIFVGLMEWNEKDQKLKGKRGNKIPLRVPSNVNYTVLRKEAEAKWKNFHSDLYDESQPYHLLYEDGQHAIYIPGSNKEPFTLGRYHEELGKDYKRMTLFLCSDIDLLQSEGLLDDDMEFECDVKNEDHVSPVSNVDLEQNNPAKRPRCNSLVSIDLTATSSSNDSNEQSGLETNSGAPSQMELDQELANHLQEMYDNEVNVCSSVAESKTNDEPLSSTTDIVKYLAAKVDTSEQQLFIVVRRNAQLNRVLSIWQREIKKKPASACYVVRVKFTGE